MPALADGVHHLAQEVLVGDLVPVIATQRELVLELGDLLRGHLLEISAHRLAGFELRRVNQERIRSVDPCTFGGIREQRQVAGVDGGVAVGIGLFVPGDPVEHHLADGGVLADDDEDRRRTSASSCLATARTTSGSRGRGGGVRPRAPWGAFAGPPATESFRPFFGISSLMWTQRSRKVGRSPSITSSEVGTRGIFTIPDSIASIRLKSETTHGKSVPSW